jgi:hypothetical protein
MKTNLFTLGLVSILAGSATAQAFTGPGPDASSTAAATIRTRIEAWGYGEVKNLSRDRTGGWHAHVVKNNVEIAVSVDKGGRIVAQSANGQLSARCNQLYDIATRYASGGAGAQGGQAADMRVIGAGFDCLKGHYDRGIETLKEVLDGQRISYPPD